MSPQRINGQAHDYRSDNWSLGVLIYELGTGEYPFCKDEDTTEIKIYDNIAKHSTELKNDKLNALALDLCNQLIVVDPMKRLGCGGIY